MSIRDLKRHKRLFIACVPALLSALALATVLGLSALPSASLQSVVGEDAPVVFTDRNGLPLNRTYQTRYNSADLIALPEAPPLLIDAFVTAEDASFYRHHGVDWRARMYALWQNLKAGHTIRGAGTISEQVVRIIHPRPRTYWSHWLEGWDAMRLERRFSKQEILEFYLNQVPYSDSRRGVVQAARYYFGRTLDTLNEKETLALAAMVRAPSLLNPFAAKADLGRRIQVLAELMAKRGLLPSASLQVIRQERLSSHPSQIPVQAPHFVSFVRNRQGAASSKKPVRTTLDAELQTKVQDLLDRRLADLGDIGIENGAVLVVDHGTAEVLSWAVAGERSGNVPGADYDAVTIPRQPGSTLKPFVYGLALDRGWTPATIIRDAPILEDVDHGLHLVRNFSQVYYGDVPLAEALGNSLNTPAVRTLDFVGLDAFYTVLQNLGITSLKAGIETYGDGLVLGNAEVSLLDLVQAYGALARGGRPMRLRVLAQEGVESDRPPVFSAESSRTIGTILSEGDFRRLEFGKWSILTFPVRTAAKTGTSTAGNDVWTVAYDGRYLVGIWFGNLDRSSPKEMITGAGGPALLARSVFAEVRRRFGFHPLPTVPLDVAGMKPEAAIPESIRMVVPSEDMEVVFDPHIPKEAQVIPFQIVGLSGNDQVQWTVDGEVRATAGTRMPWPVSRGSHRVSARIDRSSGQVVMLPERVFVVK